MKICTIARRDENIIAETAIRRACKDLNVDWIVCRGLYLYDNRNKGVVAAGDDDILFWDSDIIATAEDVQKLLALDLPIVSGAYQQRETEQYCGNIPMGETGLHEVEYCGAGFLCIKREVFKKFKDEFYFWNYKEQPGEDIGFCRQARELGYKIYVDCNCKIIHKLTSFTQTEGSMLSIKEKISITKNGIKQIEVNIYDLTIASQAATAAGSVNEIPKFQKGLEIEMKKLDFYRSHIGGLEKEVAAIETPKPSEGA